MKRGTMFQWLAVMVMVCFAGFAVPKVVMAHCDGMDGPVVTAAKAALEAGNVNLVLIWVQKEYEDEMKRVFEKTMAVRKLSSEAKELADMYFFETLVRIHRAGESEPYTGLKPAGRDLGPAIPAADKAIGEGRLEPLSKLITEKVHDGLHERFKHVMEKRNYSRDNIAAGREFVEAYVLFLHYVEGVYDAANKEVHGHHPGHAAEEHKHQ